MLDNVTIIILTHNRQEYLSRIMDYYAQFTCNILIADSSKNSYARSISEHIQYYYYPQLDFMSKLREITSLVVTPYILFCADDDFWVQESILPCIDFLDENSDYSSVQGNYIWFDGYQQNDFTPSYVHAQSIDPEDMGERLALSMKSYMPLFYALHRTEIIHKIFSDNYNTNISHAILNELSVTLYSLIYGKHKKLDILTYVRDDMSDPTPVQRDNLKEISQKDELEDEYKQFKLNLFHLISKHNPNINASQVVESTLNIYINQVRDESTIKSFIKKYFAYFLSMINHFRSKKNRQELLEEYKEIKGYPITDSIAIESWNKILKIIRKHNI